MHITTNPLKMIMSAYHTITQLGHNIVLKEIQHLSGMTQCASFSGMAQFGFPYLSSLNATITVIVYTY
jgi:hypothetical protein